MGLNIRMFVISLFGTVSLMSTVVGFPNGAPVEACITKNYPNHAGTKPLSPSTFPYAFTASSDEYFPGQQIKVVISGAPIKGFFVQARDGSPSGKWIGEFIADPRGKETKGHPECSAITHTHPGSKDKVVLTWVAPTHLHRGRKGKVVFLGTLLAKYDSYWVNMIAKTKLPHGPPHGPLHGPPHGLLSSHASHGSPVPLSHGSSGPLSSPHLPFGPLLTF